MFLGTYILVWKCLTGTELEKNEKTDLTYLCSIGICNVRLNKDTYYCTAKTATW